MLTFLHRWISIQFNSIRSIKCIECDNTVRLKVQSRYTEYRNDSEKCGILFGIIGKFGLRCTELIAFG